MQNINDIRKKQDYFNQLIATQTISPIFHFDLKAKNVGNISLHELDIDFDSIEDINAYIEKWKVDNGYSYTIGGYLEDRNIYKGNQFTATENARTIHLGIDVGALAGTPLMAPLDATVHSFANNDAPYDYGGTIILEHKIEDQTFYTLYGHLSLASLEGKYKNQKIKAGETFATLGNSKENGGWNAHLHFQIILDMQGKEGDFIGVCSKNEMDYYRLLCPNPEVMLI